MKFALRCPPEGGCDIWDRKGSIALVENPGAEESEERRIELLRFMTPYGIGGSWELDVTDLRPLLTGEHTIQAFVDTWVGPGHAQGAGWLVDVSFEFTPGTPERRAVAVFPVLYEQSAVYGDPSRPITDAVPMAEIAVPEGATSFEMHTYISGHGQGSAQNCAEFCAKTHRLTVEGTNFDERIWRDDCATTVSSEQGGTWQLSRAGWCPGDIVHPWTFAVDAPSDGAINVRYDVEEYENTCREGAEPCTGCAHRNAGCVMWTGMHTEPHYTLSSLLIAFE